MLKTLINKFILTIKKLLGIDIQIYESKLQYREFNARKRSMLLSNLKKQKLLCASDYMDVYIEIYKKFKFVATAHITDDNLSRVLYKAIKQKDILENCPYTFKKLNYICDSKNDKVNFITFEYRTYDGKYLLDDFIGFEYRLKEGEFALNNLYNFSKWFCDKFSIDNEIYIDYTKFFQNYVVVGKNFITNFLMAISLEECELSHGKLTEIIDIILENFIDKNCNSFRELQYKMQKSTNSFDAKLCRGVYDEELDSVGYYNLPVYLYSNIFRLAINENYFNDLQEFFNNSKDKSKTQMYGNLIIFDEETFESNLKQINENENFIAYKADDDVFGNAAEYMFFKIKQNGQISKIKDKLNNLLEADFIGDAKFLHSLQSDNCYIMYSFLKKKAKTLREYINDIGDDEDLMLLIILNINNAFINNENVRNSLFFSKDIDLLDVLYVLKHGNKLSFNDIFAMDFNKNENVNSFDYPFVIMESIKLFLQNNSISVDDIYTCKFITLLSSSFTEELIKYLRYQEYTSKGMIKKLKDTLSTKYYRKIEFLENIPLDNEELLSKITFLNGIVPNDKINDILIAQGNIKTSSGGAFANTNYIALNEHVSSMLNGKGYLSEYVLGRVLYDLDHQDALLIPKKVIISKDYTENGNYQFVGIIWNCSNLYSFEELIKNKAINTPEIYKLIFNVLKLSVDYKYTIANLRRGLSSLLINDNHKVVINCADLARASDINSKATLKTTYKNVMKKLNNEFGSFLDDEFTYFTYDELVPISKATSDAAQLNQIYHAIYGIKLCSDHEKWHLRGVMCPDCQNVYVIDDDDKYKRKGDLLYKSKKWNFKTFNDSYMLYSSNCITIRNVRLGIENNLYENFAPMVPKKMLLSEYKEGMDKYTCIKGVLYSNYDFSNAIDLSYFKAIQRIKVVLLLYKKILPYILNGTFLVEHSDIFKTMFMDKTRKGEIIIPDITLLETDIILSQNEELKNEHIGKTKKLFFEFLFAYIFEDSSLRQEIISCDTGLKNVMDDIRNCNFSEEHIREYINGRDSYCKVHNLYFSKENIICPKCMEDGISKEYISILSGGELKKITKQKPKYEGGEANLYPYKNNQVQKIFNDSVDVGFKSKIIGKMLQKAKLFEKFNNEHKDVKFVPINKVLYSFEGSKLKLEGYTEDLIEDSFKISSLKDKAFVKQIGYTRKDIVEILIRVCKGIQFLHSIGGFIGDLNGGNVLIKDKVVYIIDFDGMSFDDVKNCVYTNMYIYPPSAENNNITKDDDWYSLAIQAFYYLTYSHPFRGICKNSIIPTSEVERMKYGYSVLGKHGINLPNISIGWEFMPQYMINFFIETFEGKKRENMIEVLQSFLQNVMDKELRFEEIQRNRSVKFSLTEDLYIDTDNNLVYKEKILLNFGEYDDASVMRCSDCFAIKTEKNTYIFNDKTGKTYKFNKIYSPELLYADDNKIYYTSYDRARLYVDELDPDTEEISTHRIKKATNNPIYALSVNRGNKFVFIECQNSTIDIYCNTRNICNVPLFNVEVIVSITYDEVFDRWLVIIRDNAKAKGIVIDKNESNYYYDFDLEESLSNSLSFYGNILYYLGDKKICYYNVKTNKLQEFDCDMASVDSMIERKSNKFIINNKDQSYMYFKS